VRCGLVRFDSGEAGSEAERWGRSIKYCGQRAEVADRRGWTVQKFFTLGLDVFSSSRVASVAQGNATKRIKVFHKCRS